MCEVGQYSGQDSPLIMTKSHVPQVNREGHPPLEQRVVAIVKPGQGRRPGRIPMELHRVLVLVTLCVDDPSI